MKTAVHAYSLLQEREWVVSCDTAPSSRRSFTLKSGVYILRDQSHKGRYIRRNLLQEYFDDMYGLFINKLEHLGASSQKIDKAEIRRFKLLLDALIEAHTILLKDQNRD